MQLYAGRLHSFTVEQHPWGKPSHSEALPSSLTSPLTPVTDSCPNRKTLRFSICLHHHRHLSSVSAAKSWRMCGACCRAEGRRGGLVVFVLARRWCVASLAALWCSLCLPIKMCHLIWLRIAVTEHYERRHPARSWQGRPPPSVLV